MAQEILRIPLAAPEAAVYGGGYLSIKSWTDTITISAATSGASTETIPDGATLLACPMEITTALSGTGVAVGTVDLGLTTDDPDCAIDGSTDPISALTAGTTNPGNRTPMVTAQGARTITLTVGGSASQAGVVRISPVYFEVIPVDTQA